MQWLPTCQCPAWRAAVSLLAHGGGGVLAGCGFSRVDPTCVNQGDAVSLTDRLVEFD